RNYHVLAGFEYAANDWSEAGRGVHDHHVAPFASGAEQVAQEGGFRYEFLIEGMVRRLAHRANQHGAKPGKCSWKDDFAELTLTHEIVGEAVGRVAASQPHAVANGALRVGVYHQRFQAAARECCGKVYGCSGLSNATLLAYDGDNVPHAHRPPRGEVRPSPPAAKLPVRSPRLGGPAPAH